MNRRILSLLVAGLLLTIVHHAEAQRIPSRMRQATTSPYINLFRGDTGGLNSYYSFVRPLQMQQQFNNMQMSQNQRMQQQLYNAQSFAPSQDYAGGMVGPGGTMFRASANGVGLPTQSATFFNYSHFYGSQISGPGGAGGGGLGFGPVRR